MKRSTITLTLFSAIMLLISGCVTTRDYGAGKCKEYMPACMAGRTVCEIDKLGCKVCNCVPFTQPTPYGPR